MPIEVKQPMYRDLFLSGNVDVALIKEITKAIIDINNSDDELEKHYAVFNITYNRQAIKIYIDTYGGYVYQMMGLIGVIEQSKTKIFTIATGAAMSAGFLILISGHRRFAYPLATPMYHQFSNWGGGKIQDLAEDQVQLERVQKMMEKHVVRKTSITKKQLMMNRARKIDWFMTAKEALTLKVIDEII